MTPPAAAMEPAGGGPASLAADLAVDLAVVGGGPVGLYAAYCSGFRGLSTAVVDALPEPGGQVAALYPEKLIYDIAGYPEVRGRELVSRLVEQADRYAPHYVLGSPAVDLEHQPDGTMVVVTGAGTRVAARAVVVAGGIGSFTPRPLPAARAFQGRGLAYFVPRLADLADMDVVIVGGGDSAFDWALALESIARSVTLVHRRSSFRAHAGTVSAVVGSSNVAIITDAQVVQARGDGWLEAVTVEHAPSGESYDLPCQALVAALGFVADLGPLEAWGVSIVDRHVVVDSRMRTTVPGVYAAGDITEYPGKVRIIAVGFGEAATAVNNAAAALDPDSGIFPGHSSEH
ncbi:MAG: ferredoxin--NADP reductase [Actinotalea sp.]|nr:ferredoxin--NADP reductase [Actinotalea sp.]